MIVRCQIACWTYSIFNAVIFSLNMMVGVGSLAGPVYAQSETIVREIADYERQIQQNRELIKARENWLSQIDQETLGSQASLSELERQVRPRTAALEVLKAESQKTKGLFEMALANPEIADTAKLDGLRKEHYSSKAKLDKITEEVFGAEREIEARRKALSDMQNQRRTAEMELEILYRGTRSLLLKKPVIVEASGECLMHEDITIRSCKEMAILKAKQDAVEKGGVSIVRSLTEVALHDIKRDDIRVESTGKIRELEIVKQLSFSAEGEHGKWTVAIRAAIQSQTEIGGGVNGEASAARVTPQPKSANPLDRQNATTFAHSVQPIITPTSAFHVAYNDYLNGNYAQAIGGFERFVKTFPSTSLTPNAHYWLGESYFQQKDFARAMQAFEYVSTEYPGNEKVPSALLRLGLAAAESGDRLKARRTLKRVTTEFPLSDEARFAKLKLVEIR
jgi:tol-pal system protein YbgF